MRKTVYHLEKCNIKTKEDLHKLLKEDLPLPEYYGDNLDALNDALWEIGDGVIEFKGIDQIPEELRGYAESMNDIFANHRMRIERETQREINADEGEPQEEIDWDETDWDEDSKDWDYEKDYIYIDNPSVYGILMAAGKGERIGGDFPKQFAPIKGKPLFIRSLQNMLTYGEFEKLIVVAPKDWEGYTKKLIEEYIKEDKASLELIDIITGGDTRLESLSNALKYIVEHKGKDKEIIAVTHDAARPFVTKEMISSSVEEAKTFVSATAAIPVTDTIAMDEKGDWENLPIKMIKKIPSRSSFLQIQTPQSFYVDAYLSCLEEIEALGNKKEFITDAAGVFTLAGRKVAASLGDRKNIKITYPEDFKIAEALIEE